MTTPPQDSHPVERGGRPPETVDRLMIGACGAIWLVFLVVGVIATVALVNLGRGHGGAGEQSSWLLYTIIAVSAVTIAAAIPLLLRARRDAMASHAAADPEPVAIAKPAIDAPTEKIRVFGTSVDPLAAQVATSPTSASVAAVERESLRGTLALMGLMGLAATAVATATYLLAVESDTAAWAVLGVAGLFTAGMPVVAVIFGRRLSAAA
ncbi:MAG TPA: DUF2561 family protein [Mycobacterium sp.]|nr:DUF2561 family protein [Mycobacterium sp.]